MKFLDSVITAFQVFKKGADVLNELDEDKETGFAAPPTTSFKSKLRPARASLRDLERPLGLQLPRMETMVRYWATQLARDNNLRQIQATDYYTPPVKADRGTMTIASDANVKGFTASYKTTGVTAI